MATSNFKDFSNDDLQKQYDKLYRKVSRDSVATEQSDPKDDQDLKAMSSEMVRRKMPEPLIDTDPGPEDVPADVRELSNEDLRREARWIEAMGDKIDVTVWHWKFYVRTELKRRLTLLAQEQQQSDEDTATTASEDTETTTSEDSEAFARARSVREWWEKQEWANVMRERVRREPPVSRAQKEQWARSEEGV